MGDHLLQVHGVDVTEVPHTEVVGRIREGDGQGKTVMLVVDPQTEAEMKERVSGSRMETLWNCLLALVAIIFEIVYMDTQFLLIYEVYMYVHLSTAFMMSL